MDLTTLSYEDRTAIEELNEFIKTLESRTKDGQLLFTLGDDQQTQLLILIKGISLATLIRLAMEDSRVDALCKQASLEPYWNERWRLSGRNPSELAKKIISRFMNTCRNRPLQPSNCCKEFFYTANTKSLVMTI